MTAQPATQTGSTCGECRIEVIPGTTQARVLLCSLHAQAEATAEERDALLALLRRAALGEEPQVRAYHDPLCGECLGCQARAAIAAAQPRHAAQEGEAG